MIKAKKLIVWGAYCKRDGSLRMQLYFFFFHKTVVKTSSLIAWALHMAGLYLFIAM